MEKNEWQTKEQPFRREPVSKANFDFSKQNYLFRSPLIPVKKEIFSFKKELYSE